MTRFISRVSFRHALVLVGCAAGFTLTGCATGGSAPKEPRHSFETTYQDPDAKPMHVRGTKVVAAVMIQDPKARKKAEDQLAREITARGGQGIPMYSISADTATSQEGESKTRAAVEAVGAQGLVVMRPVDIQHKTQQTDMISNDSVYGGYWGGYYGVGWNDPWIEKSPDVSVELVITVETFVFSLPQNKLVWSGTSETTSPKNAEKLVHQLAGEAATELERLGLIAK